MLPGVFGFVRAGAIAITLWLASALAAQAAGNCNFNVAFNAVGDSVTFNTNACETTSLGAYSSFYNTPTPLNKPGGGFNWGLGAADNGDPLAEEENGVNGGRYRFLFTNASSSLTITLVTAPSQSTDTYNGYMYTGTNNDPNPIANTPASLNITYTGMPTVTAVTPSSGPTGGGTSVTITGTGFTGATAVAFGATPATGYTIVSSSQINATAPSGSAGTVDITVTTANGTSAISASDRYTYVAAPTVTAVSPTAGPTAGGTSVVITGTGFLAASPTGAVKFGGANATYTINNNTQITATAPANAAGTYDITVTTPGGTSATSAADQYTYVAAPTVTSVSPNTGTTGGGTTVTITGTGLSGATAVTFGGSPAIGYTVNSGTQITATAPSGSAGTVDIRVTTVGGTSAISASDQFTYVAAPAVTAVSPIAGPTGGGMTVVISGSGFAAANGTGAVKFGAANATYTINSNTQITATSPANSAGTYDVTVTTPGGTSATSMADQFTYVAAPTVTAVSPNAGPTAGGTTVVIIGTGFSAANGTGAVKFGATNATYTINSNTQITATAPANSAGTYDITVTTPGGTSATNASDQYTYVAAPTVTAISPTSGPTAGGATVVITGTGFATATAVSFGGSPATGFTVNSNTQITATAPAGAAGTVDITVTTIGGTSATSASDQYLYVAPPVASSFTYGTIVAYNSSSVSIDLSTNASNSPTSYAVGSATTAQGGSVSVDSSGQATYTPPVGYRNANDSFTFTATNLGGTSSPATVTVTVGNPTIAMSLPSATAIVERAYNTGGAAVTFSGANAPYTVNSISGLPAGLTDSGGGVISGTPAVNGVFTVTVNVTDSSLGAGPYNANTTATLTVSLPPAPVASSFAISGLTYNAGSASVTTFSAAPHATESPTGYQVGASSYGATVSVDSAGLMSYTPPVGFRGTDTFNYVATNAGGTSNVSQVFVTVDDPVFSVTLPSATATVERAYNPGNATVTVSGGNAPYTVNSISGLPAGLVDSGGGVISGTPAVNGVFTVSVNITDSSGGNGSHTAIATATLTVALPPAPVASSFSISGLAYNTGSASATTFSAATHATESPTGYQVGASSYGATVSVDSAGLMSYTPPVGFRGTDTFNYVATNAGGTSNVGQVFVSVNDPVFSVTLPAATGTVGDVYNSGGFAVSISGGNPPYNNFSASGLPDGLSMDSAGVISGTPTAAGNATVVITATDSSGGNGSFTSTASANINIAVPTIVINPTTLSNAAIGVPYGATLSNTGGLAPVTFAVTAGSLPPGLTLATDGTVSGTPTGGGTYNFTVTATDSATATGPYSGARAYALTVDAATITLSPAAGALPGGTTGAAYSQSFSATGGTGPYSYAVVTGALPAGLTLNSTGVLSGTPTEGGSFTFAIEATDSSTGAGPYLRSQTYSLTIGAPTIAVAPSTLPDATTGIAYSEIVTASGGIGPYSYAITSGTLPTGLTLNTAGVLSGTPTAGGTFTFTVSATDSSAGTGPFTGAQAYTFTVAAPTIAVAPSTLPDTATGVAYNQTVTASGGIGPYSYSVTAGALPAGLTLSTAGVLTGTPTAGGTFNITITATDSSTGAGPYTGAQAYTLTVTAPTIAVAPSSLPNAAIGVAYSETVTASGGIGPYSYSVTSGTLPAGLTLSTAGVLTGTPTAGGTFNFTASATDSSTGVGPYTGAQAYTLTIAAPTIAVAPSTLPNAAIGAAYSQAITASGGIGPYSYSVTSGTLPAGLSLSPAGVLSGVPTEVGTSNITISATDAATGTGPFSGAQSYALVVDQVLPIANAVTATVAANSTANGITLAITGGAADSVAVASSAANGIATASGTTITYTPTAGYSGTDSFTYTATNAAGTSSPATVTVTVTAPTLSFSPAAGGLADGTKGASYSQALSASGGTAPYAYTVTTGALPAGLALDGATGRVSGTPTATGSFGFTVTATDAYGATGSATYSLAIRAMAAFTFTPAPGNLGDAMAGEDYRQQIAATGGTAPLLYRIGSGTLPGGMVLNVSTGELTGPLDAASQGNYTFAVVVEDNNGATGSATYSMTVKSRGTTVTDQVVNVPAGTSPPDVYLNRGATGGPFTAAEVAFVEPPNAGTATIIQGRLAQAGPVAGPVGWYLQFTPNPAFSGAAKVGFRLTSSLGSSNVGTVTYNLAYVAADVAEDINALVSGFVETRQGLIANGIYVPGLLERRQMQHATDAVTARMTPSEDGMTATISTSLAQLDAARDNADGISGAALPPFNIWIDGTFLAHKRDQNDGKWGNFAMLNLGADYLLSERALVGLSLHYDRMTDPSDADAELTGNGWLAGPYASFEIGKGVYWDTSLLYGGSANDIDTAFWDGDFDTTRWMIDSAIKGEWQIDDATVLTPKLRAVYFNEKVDDYSVRNDAGDEVTIDGFDVEQFRVSLGAEIARSFTLENGSALTPKVGVTAGYSGQDGSGLFASITAGLSLETADFWMLSADLLFDIEGDGEKAIGGKVRAGKQF